MRTSLASTRGSKDICTAVREVIWDADPDIEETIKRSVQPYFVLNGNGCALLATNNHINLFLYDPTIPDPAGINQPRPGEQDGVRHPDLQRR